MMELVNPAIDQRLVHPAMQPVEVGIEQEEVERVFERNDPPAGGLAVEQDPAVFLQVGRAIAEDEDGAEQIEERTSGVEGKRVLVRVELCGRRTMKKTKRTKKKMRQTVK